MTNMTFEHLIKPWKPRAQKTYIFYHANIVDPVNGSIRQNVAVKISAGLVKSVTDTEMAIITTNDGAITIDLEGKYLCPGLIDAHVHVTAVPGENDLGGVFGLSPEVSMMRQPFVCQQILRRGFTSVRDCGGASLALKEAINEGVIQGPRLFIAGHGLTQTGGHADLRGPYDHTDCCGGAVTGLGRLCDGVPECIKAAREELRTGADFIKIMGGGGVASPTDRLENIQFTAEEVRAITTVAENSGTFVTAHAYTTKAIQFHIENGVKGIEHGNMITPECARYMAKNGIYLTPTLIAYSAMASLDFPGFLPLESVVKNNQVLRAGFNALGIAHKAGVTMCYGSDLLGPLGIAQTHEFALRAQVLDPTTILQCATINPARMLRQSEFLGQIKSGFSADLLILNKNPLEDILVLDNPDAHLLGVIKEGRVHVSRWSKLQEDHVSNPVTVIE
ncbi:MAG: hypothetical protein M1834_005834 [Cirrosporium novae-zelandiae]|nr:MAG: hypothetical protein M1834_005834 [Cirrosporium novae-zelandiae]